MTPRVLRGWVTHRCLYLIWLRFVKVWTYGTKFMTRTSHWNQRWQLNNRRSKNRTGTRKESSINTPHTTRPKVLQYRPDTHSCENHWGYDTHPTKPHDDQSRQTFENDTRKSRVTGRDAYAGGERSETVVSVKTQGQCDRKTQDRVRRWVSHPTSQ